MLKDNLDLIDFKKYDKLINCLPRNIKEIEINGKDKHSVIPFLSRLCHYNFNIQSYQSLKKIIINPYLQSKEI